MANPTSERFGFRRPVDKFSQSAKSAIGAKKAGGKLKDYTYPNDLPENTRFVLSFYSYEYGRSKGRISQLKGIVNLPIPTKMVDSQGISYNEAEIGIVGGLLAKSAGELLNNTGNAFFEEGPRAAGKTLVDTIRGLAEGAMDTISGGSVSDNVMAVIGAGNALKFVNKDMGNLASTVAGTAGNILGKVPNPHLVYYFKGVALKEYTFNWTLYPRSQSEASTIQNMVKFIKQSILPSNTFGGLLLTYPDEAHIHVMSEGELNFMKFKPAMIKTAAIDFTPNGLSIMEDGKPAGVTLSITFHETDIWTREDYNSQVETGSGV